MKKLSVALGAALLLVATPRIARAELWINLDQRFYLWTDQNKQCTFQRFMKGFRVYSCAEGSGTLHFAYEDEGMVCVLSIWYSSGRWNAEIAPSPKWPNSKCGRRWENNNTVKVYVT
jgi:hypothetical protein